MIKYFLNTVLLLSIFTCLSAENMSVPRVPSELSFAGMKLKITEAARRDIQKEVDALRQSEKYFNIKLDRVKLYFPIMENVLKQEGVPDDFKFLAVQESGLISDEVSSSNAVGFWQFKDFTGKEVGLRIDRNVDERLNIVASTRGAAKYFKRHNFFFKNWVYTILAHMTGRGGAEKYVDKNKFGVSKMTINEKTHWYVKRFLAYKIAFEKEAKGSHSEGMKLMEYKKGQNKTLSQISDNLDVDEELLKKYNKWLKRGRVPTEKEYSVIVPIKNKVPKALIAEKKRIGIQRPSSQSSTILGQDLNRNRTIFIKINGINSILAKNKETAESLAAEGGVAITKFLKYNDLKPTDAIIQGEVYYLKSKKNKANVYYHTTEPGESLWDISQKFGVKLKKLAKMNRMSIIDQPETGRLMWLRKTRPKETPIEIKPIPTRDEIEEILNKDDDYRENVVEKGRDIFDDNTNGSNRNVSYLPKASDSKTIPKNSIGKVHIVEKGETLYGISKIYNVEVMDLMNLNDSDGTLKIGQRLLIPESAQVIEQPKEKSKNITTFHVVEPGDTIYNISRKYNLGVDEILKLNKKDNFDITVGQKLIIKK